MNTTPFDPRLMLLEQLQKIDERSPTGVPFVRRIKPYAEFVSVIKNTSIDLNTVQPHKLKFISDTHFGHTRIIEYCNRPYATADEMTNVILQNYRNGVADDDVVVWVGDVAFAGHTKINELLQTLPGYKILIVGNHDFERRKKQLIPYDFDEIRLVATVRNFVISHHPWWDVPHGWFHVHGHTHNRLIPGNQHINVCVERTNYKPISFSTILDNLNDDPSIEQPE